MRGYEQQHLTGSHTGRGGLSSLYRLLPRWRTFDKKRLPRATGRGFAGNSVVRLSSIAANNNPSDWYATPMRYQCASALTILESPGDYSTWFFDQESQLLLNALDFIVAGLSDPALSLHAAGSLKQLCDANRTKLAPHISAFAQIHTSSANIPVSDTPPCVIPCSFTKIRIECGSR